MSGFSGPDLLDQFQPRLEAANSALADFFTSHRATLPEPIYGSIDVRDAGWKVAAVDANAFPAGFNNVGKRDRRGLSQCLVAWVDREHPEAEHIHIWPESHTRNPGYVENLRVLSQMLAQKGRLVTIGSPELAGHAALEGHVDTPCLWLRGLPPAHATPGFSTLVGLCLYAAKDPVDIRTIKAKYQSQTRLSGLGLVNRVWRAGRDYF